MAALVVDFRLLGDVEVRVDGQVVNVGHLRQRCVLVALVLEAGHVVGVDQLIDRAWSEPPAGVRATLHSYVSRLRQVLPVPILRQPGGYLLETEPETVDVQRFRRLLTQARSATEDETAAELFEHAMGLWRGDAFAGLDTAWVASVRHTLELERADAQRDYVDVALRLGRHSELLADLTARGRANPLDEHLGAQLMLALHRSGRQAEALAHYGLVQSRLQADMGLDPGPEIRELHQRILAADPRLALRRPDSRGSPQRPSGPVPRQLPAPPPGFTARDAELSTLDDLDRPVVISGSGGIGKTWLALHWAHRNLDRFPDGQLYVNLRGYDPSGTPMAPASALRGFLESLQVDPQSIPHSVDAQAALYRSLIAGRRMLVVLDNARDTDHVLPLLPGDSAGAVLITSRRRLPGLVATRGAVPLDLDVFTEAEARDLLARHLGADRLAAEPETSAALLAHCAGLPLAIAIVAAIADEPLSDLAARLTDARTRLDALDAGEPAVNLRVVLSSSYKALSWDAARLFALLAIAPGPDIGLAGAAALAGEPAQLVRTRLRELEHAHLVDQYRPGRYRMHDLIRLHGAELAELDHSRTVRMAGLRGLVDYYLHTAHDGERLLNPHSREITLKPPSEGVVIPVLPDGAAATAWFDDEYANLVAAQKLAETTGWHTDVWQLAWVTTSYQSRRASVDSMIASWDAAVAAARRLGDVPVQALAHRILGMAHRRAGRAEATTHLTSALALATQDGDVHAQALTHHALAHTLEHWGEDHSALAHITSALHLFRMLDNEIWQAEALNWRGWLLAKAGRDELAVAHCEQALALHRKHDDQEGEANALDSLGHAAHLAGRHLEAVEHYNAALALFREVGDTYEEANTLCRLAEAQAALGRSVEARVTWQVALGLLRAQHRAQDVERVQRQLSD